MGVNLSSATTMLSQMLAVQGVARLDNIGHQAEFSDRRELHLSVVSPVKILFFVSCFFCMGGMVLPCLNFRSDFSSINGLLPLPALCFYGLMRSRISARQLNPDCFYDMTASGNAVASRSRHMVEMITRWCHGMERFGVSA